MFSFFNSPKSTTPKNVDMNNNIVNTNSNSDPVPNGRRKFLSQQNSDAIKGRKRVVHSANKTPEEEPTLKRAKIEQTSANKVCNTFLQYFYILVEMGKFYYFHF